MKLAISASHEDAAVIRELLSIWEVSWVSSEDSDVVICYRRKPPGQSKNTILIPSNSMGYEIRTNRQRYIDAKKPFGQTSVVATPGISLSFTPETSYETRSATSGAGEDQVIAKSDFVEEYKRILRQTLNAGSSLVYRLATSFPVAYSVAPKSLRNYLMKKHGKHSRFNILDVLPLDALRYGLANAIEQSSRKKLRRRTWNNRSSVCVLTHDIETKEGLRKSVRVKKLEEKYNLPSAWFVPSAQYPLDQGIIEELGNNGEVGSHDTKHDGRLSNLSKRKLVERLDESKRSLESITNHPVRGFRAPLLQHTSEILHGLNECGFKYDTSIPTWEPKHPRTMRPHGVGTLFPITVEGMNEIPITMLQDHQLLHVLGLTPKEAIEEWLSNLTIIKELGGFSVFLSHPEYGLLDRQGIRFYEELLNAIASDRELLVTLPHITIGL